MTERDWYNGVPHAGTVLILGEVFPDRPPNTVSLLFGQTADETYQTKAYLDGLLTIRKHATYVDWSPLFCALSAGMVAARATCVLEIGSTLFATIDKLEKLDRLAHSPSVDGCVFIGIEPSAFFCDLAEVLHPTQRLQHFQDLSEVPPIDARHVVTRCYQASSYAFASTEEFVAYCARGLFGSHGVWCSVDGTTRIVSAMGKRLTLFGMPEYCARMNALGYRVRFVQRSRTSYAGAFEFVEAWLVYDRFDSEEEQTFQDELHRLKTVTGDEARLWESFEAAPHVDRPDAAFSGLVPDSRILDFTSPEALTRFGAWRRTAGASPSLGGPLTDCAATE